jgi:FAD/FMN-containing dehydrogenase
MTAAGTSLVVRLAETAPGLRVETGPGATGPYAYDASNYRVTPQAVAYPRTADDVVAVLRACREAGCRSRLGAVARAWPATPSDPVWCSTSRGT